MKFSADAGSLASALSLVATLAIDKVTRRLPIWGAVRLVAGDSVVTISLYNGDAQLELTVVAEITETGEVAVDAAKLAALVAGFPAKACIVIAAETTVAVVRSGRSKFRLPVLPVADLSVLALGDETGYTVISRADAIALLRPTFAVSTENTRYYLNGLALQNDGGDLLAIGTDAHRLARSTIKSAGGLSDKQGCIAPLSTLKLIHKLLAAQRNVAEFTLRRSPTLFEIAAAGRFTLTSKLIDAVYPDWRGAISGGGSGSNIVVVDRLGLLAALERVSAVVGDKALAGLVWGPEREGLHVYAAGAGDAAHDILAAEVRGIGEVAFTARHGRDWLEEFDSDIITIDAGAAPGVPIWITGGAGGDDLLVVQMPCRWSGGAPGHQPDMAEDVAA